jgi:multidrug efflux pump subunit AcrA (membrane-fusion protein)
MCMVHLSLLAAAVVAATPATPGSSPPKNYVVVQHCQVFLIDGVDVPAHESGPLVDMRVQEGFIVKQDDLLAQIDDKQAQLMKLSAEAERDAAYERARDDIDVRYAMKSAELAEAELKQDLEIKSRSSGAVTDAEIRRKQLVKTRELLGVDKAKLDRRIAQLTANLKKTAVDATDDSILRRRILAPFDGMVVDVYKKKAEWVNAGEPVLRVVRMDRLRVDGFLSGDEIGPTDVAKRAVTVEIELAQGRRERFDGQVVFVNPLVQAGNKYRIRVEVDNRFEKDEPLLRPGMNANMIIQLDKGG